MPDREKVIKGLETIRFNLRQMNHGLLADFCDDALALLKEQQEQIDRLLEESASNAEMAEGMKELLKEQKETIQITKNVAERYANILADKGVNGVWVRYAVKKGKQFMLSYQNKKASWCYGLDGAWMTFDREMAEGFAKVTNGKLIEVTLTERPLLLE